MYLLSLGAYANAIDIAENRASFEKCWKYVSPKVFEIQRMA